MKKIIYVLLVLVSMQLYGQNNEYTELQVTTSEEWLIDDVNYAIIKTTITGKQLFTILVKINHIPLKIEEKEKIANKIASFAVEEGYLENALKYNSYNNELSIYDNIVAVILISYEKNETDVDPVCYFGFYLDDLDISENRIKEIPPPITFTNEERNILLEKIKTIIYTRYFDDLIDLYSKKILENNKFDIEKTKLDTAMNFSLVKEYEFIDKDFLIYIGNKQGINGYDFFIPIMITPIANTEEKFKAFIKVNIIDEKPIYGIYNIQLNITKSDDLNTLVNVGNMTVPFKTRNNEKSKQ